MPKMLGTGTDPLGRYSKGLIFDLEDNDPEMVQDFIDKGWATLLPEEDHPGRTKTQVAAAIVRGDALSDPVEQKLADEIGEDAHAIVHLDDPNASESDYDDEAQKGPAKNQREVKNQVPHDYEGGPIRQSSRGRGSRSSSGDSGSGSSSASSGSSSGAAASGSSGSSTPPSSK